MGLLIKGGVNMQSDRNIINRYLKKRIIELSNKMNNLPKDSENYNKLKGAIFELDALEKVLSTYSVLPW